MALQQHFKPANAEHAANLKRRIIQSVCRQDVEKYLDEQMKLYDDLFQVDLDRMSDKEFYEILIDALPDDNYLMHRVASIRNKIDCWASETDSTLSSDHVISWIWQENWQLNKDKKPSELMINNATHQGDFRGCQAKHRFQPYRASSSN
jgi:hypothetical protein